MARDFLRAKEFEMPDCSFLLDNLMLGVAEGALGFQTEEFQLISSIITKVMTKRGKLGYKGVNLDFLSLLQKCSKV